MKILLKIKNKKISSYMKNMHLNNYSSFSKAHNLKIILNIILIANLILWKI